MLFSDPGSAAPRMIQNRLSYHLRTEGLSTQACSLVTQVLVRNDDPDFGDPSKPVGPFYTEAEPQEIVEVRAIRALLEGGFVVIASGGGGIPVARNGNGSLHGVNAVIDKDKARFTLAKAVKADTLMILTDVEKVSLRFGNPQACRSDVMGVSEAEGYLADGHFLKGSMGPKVEACVRFVRWSGKPAIIGSLDKAVEALAGTSGTRFVP